MLESVTSIDRQYHYLLRGSEWVITVIFSIEYMLRIVVVKRPFKYIFSFYGIVDLLSVLPTYIAVFFVGGHSLVGYPHTEVVAYFPYTKVEPLFSGRTVALQSALEQQEQDRGIPVFHPQHSNYCRHPNVPDRRT